MTGSNTRSDGADGSSGGGRFTQRLMIGGVVALCAALTGWHLALYHLVRENDRTLATRETALDRRLSKVEAQEAQRDALQSQILDLEARKAKAQEEAEQAARLGADATTRKAERDRVLRETQEAREEFARIKVEVEAGKARITTHAAEETALRTRIAAQADSVADLDKQSRDLQASLDKLKAERADVARKLEGDREAARDAADQRSRRDAVAAEGRKAAADLAGAQAALEAARAQRAAFETTQSAIQQANAARVSAERDLAKATGDLQGVLAKLAEARAEAAMLEKQKAAQQADEAKTRRAEEARAEAERNLARVQAELSGAQKRLIELQADLARAERARAAQVLDEAAALRAEAARREAERALADAQAQTTAAQKRLSDLQAEMSRIEQARKSQALDEEAARRAKSERTAAEADLAKMQSLLADYTSRLAALAQRIQDLSHIAVSAEAGAMAAPILPPPLPAGGSDKN